MSPSNGVVMEAPAVASLGNNMNSSMPPRRTARRRGSELPTTLMEAALAAGGGGGRGTSGGTRERGTAPGAAASSASSAQSFSSWPFAPTHAKGPTPTLDSSNRSSTNSIRDDRSGTASSLTSLSSMFGDEDTWHEFKIELEASKLKTGAGIQEVMGRFVAEKRRRQKEEEERVEAAGQMDQAPPKDGEGLQGRIVNLPAAVRRRSSHGSAFMNRIQSGLSLASGLDADEQKEETIWNSLDQSFKAESYADVIRGDASVIRGEAACGSREEAKSEALPGKAAERGHGEEEAGQGPNLLGLFRWGGGGRSNTGSVKSDGARSNGSAKSDGSARSQRGTGSVQSQGSSVRSQRSEGGLSRSWQTTSRPRTRDDDGGSHRLSKSCRERTGGEGTEGTTSKGAFSWFGLGGDRARGEQEDPRPGESESSQGEPGDGMARVPGDGAASPDARERKRLLMGLMGMEGAAAARSAHDVPSARNAAAASTSALRPRDAANAHDGQGSRHRGPRSCLKPPSGGQANPPNLLALAATEQLRTSQSSEGDPHEQSTMHLLRLLLDLDGSPAEERARLPSSGNSWKSLPVGGSAQDAAVGGEGAAPPQAPEGLARGHGSTNSLLVGGNGIAGAAPLPFKYRPRRKHTAPRADGDGSSAGSSKDSNHSKDVKRRYAPTLQHGGGPTTNQASSPPRADGEKPTLAQAGSSTNTLERQIRSMASTGSVRDGKERHVPSVAGNHGQNRNQDWPSAPAPAPATRNPSMVSTGSSLDMRRRRVRKMGKASNNAGGGLEPLASGLGSTGSLLDARGRLGTTLKSPSDNSLIKSMVSTGSSLDMRRRNLPRVGVEEAGGKNQEWGGAGAAPGTREGAAALLARARGSAPQSVGRGNAVAPGQVANLKVGTSLNGLAGGRLGSIEGQLSNMVSTGSLRDLRKRRVHTMAERGNTDWALRGSDESKAVTGTRDSMLGASLPSAAAGSMGLRMNQLELGRARAEADGKAVTGTRDSMLGASLPAAAASSMGLQMNQLELGRARTEADGKAVTGTRDSMLGASLPAAAASSMGLQMNQLELGRARTEAVASGTKPLPTLLDLATNQAADATKQVRMTPLTSGGARGASHDGGGPGLSGGSNLFQRYLENKARGIASSTPASSIEETAQALTNNLSMDVRCSANGSDAKPPASTGELLVDWGDAAPDDDEPVGVPEPSHGMHDHDGPPAWSGDRIVTVDHAEAAQRRVSDITTATEDRYLTIQCNKAAMRRVSDLTTAIDSDDDSLEGDVLEEEGPAPAAFKQKMRSLSIREEDEYEALCEDDFHLPPPSQVGGPTSYIQSVTDDEGVVPPKPSDDEQDGEFFFYFGDDDDDDKETSLDNGLQLHDEQNEEEGADQGMGFKMGERLIRNMSRETLHEGSDDEMESDDDGANKN